MDPGKVAVSMSFFTLPILAVVSAGEDRGSLGEIMSPVVAVLLAFLHILFLAFYHQWTWGHSHPSGDGVIVLSMIIIIMSGFSLVAFSMSSIVINMGQFVQYLQPAHGHHRVYVPGRQLMFITSLLALVQYQCCQLAAFQRISKLHLPINSSVVDDSRPQTRRVIAEGMAAVSQASIHDLSQVAGDFSKAVGRYKEKHMIVLGTSMFSIFAVGFNLMNGISTEHNDLYLANASASATAKVAIAIGIGACLSSCSSLIHDHGFSQFPEDRSMRMSVVCKTCLTMAKVALTYQLTSLEQEHTTTGFSYYLLVTSTLTSLAIAVVLTFPGRSSDTVDILKSKGQTHPHSIVRVARALWIFAQLGSAVFIIQAASGLFAEAIGFRPGSIMFPAVVGIGFVAGSALGNEIAVLSADPHKNFGSAHSAAGVRVLAYFMIFTIPGSIFFGLIQARDSMRDYALPICFPFPHFFLIGIWFCAVWLSCIIRATPVPGPNLVPLLKEDS